MIREPERKGKYICFVYTQTCIFITKYPGYLPRIIIVLVSITGPDVIVGIYSYLLLLRILYSLCLQQVPQLVRLFTWWSDPNSHS